MSPPISSKQLTTDHLLPTQLPRLHLEPIAFEDIDNSQPANSPHTCIQQILFFQKHATSSLLKVRCGLI